MSLLLAGHSLTGTDRCHWPRSVPVTPKLVVVRDVDRPVHRRLDERLDHQVDTYLLFMSDGYGPGMAIIGSTPNAGRWTVRVSRVAAALPRQDRYLSVEVELIDPDGEREVFEARTSTPSGHRVPPPPAWWGAFAVAATDQLVTTVRSNTLTMVSVDDGMPVLNIDALPTSATGPSLNPPPASLVNEVDIALAR